jgi:hypothetical protein
VTETAFDAWVREAEPRLLLAAEYPLIDDAQIGMDDELRDCANRVVEEHLGEVSMSIPANIEPTIAFLQQRLIDSESSHAVRFVILNFLYRLAHFTGFGLKESEREIRGTIWPHLETFVGLQEVSDLNDPKAILWEITNSCVIHSWDRASELLDSLKSSRAITASEHRGLRGQMRICSVLAPRDEIEDEEEEGGLKDFMGWWVVKLDREYIPGGDILVSFIRPSSLLTWGKNLTDDERYSPEERERLSDAAQDWEIGFAGNTDLLGSYRAAWGKCYWLKKEYLRAATHFDQLLARGSGLPPELETFIRPRPQFYMNASECYQKAGDTEAAIRRLEECAKEFPQTGGIWLNWILTSKRFRNVSARKKRSTPPLGKTRGHLSPSRSENWPGLACLPLCGGLPNQIRWTCGSWTR